MSTTSHRLEKGELVDDRALTSTSTDEFSHDDFAEELADLVCTVEAPANVALFAPWGSGKTGLGNLLRIKLDRRAKVHFARFDAFKYAEAPLRRHFLSQVATDFELDNDKYHKDLYRSKAEHGFKLPGRDLQQLAGAFVLTVLVVGLALAVVAVIVAAVLSATGRPTFGSALAGSLKTYLLAAIPVSGIAALFLQMAGKGFSIDTTRSAPSGEEEFEDLFKALVKDAKKKHAADRLVVFIDELDRCSPQEVVSTLETIKTFLWVDDCVFVVAADLQVLEQALRQQARQATPHDTSNPYYSAGSSYLDKVFQYQVSLPPLKPRRLSRFAQDLVRNKPGVWSRITNRDEVISVLVPTHVTSPRRVKVLLNSFALTYRLAERRAEKELLGEVAPRAAEIAKLVALRCEFPLFANDLELDHRMPEIVSALAGGREPPEHIRPDVLKRARAYARGELAVGELLITEQPAIMAAAEVVAAALSPQGRAPADATADADVESAADDDPEELATTPAADGEVQHEYALQLLRYLSKVARVAGPGRDLIYMESAGVTVDLEPNIAEEIDRAAADNDTATVVRRVSRLSAEQQESAILLLAEIVSERHVDIESQNAVSTLLQTIARTDIDLSRIADRVADAVAGHRERVDEMSREDATGALKLAFASSRAEGDRLLGLVLANERALEDIDVSATLVEGAAKLSDGHDDKLGEAAARVLLSDGNRYASAVLSLDDATASRVFGTTREPLRLAVKAFADDENGQKADLDSDFKVDLSRVLNDVHASGRAQLITAAYALALSVNTTEAREVAEEHLTQLGDVTDPELTRLMIQQGRIRAAPLWTTWFSRLDGHVIAEMKDGASLMGSLYTRLWQRLNEADDDAKRTRVRADMAPLNKLVSEGAPRAGEELTTAIAETLGGAALTDAAIEKQSVELAFAAEVVEAELLDQRALADIDLASCAAILRSPTGPVATPQPGQPPSVATSTQNVVPGLLNRVRAAVTSATTDALDDIWAAIEDCSWLGAPRREVLFVLVAAARHKHDADTPSPYSPEVMHEFSEQHGPEFDEALASWMVAFSPSPEDVWTGIGPLAGGSLSAEVATGLREYSDKLAPMDKLALAMPALDAALENRPTQSFLRAIHFAEATASEACDKLIELAHKADNRDKRETVLMLWKTLGPTSENDLRRLAREVYIPIVRAGGRNLDLALEYFGLVASATKQTRTNISNALRDAATNERQRKRIDERRIDAGWASRSLFRRKVRDKD